MTVAQLTAGQKAIIKSIAKGQNAERRLFELGIMPGVEIEMLNKHPFNGPVIIKVGFSQLAIGKGIAEFIEVELNPERTA
jgi:ferrous iron transport protein A